MTCLFICVLIGYEDWPMVIFVDVRRCSVRESVVLKSNNVVGLLFMYFLCRPSMVVVLWV